MRSQTPGQPVLLAAEPQLFVADMSASFESYLKKLGFSLAFSYPWGARTFVVRDPDGNLLLFAAHGQESNSAPSSSSDE